MERQPPDPKPAGNICFRTILCQKLANLAFGFAEFLVLNPERPAEMLSFSFDATQRFFCPRRNQVSFNFGRQRKGKSQNLGLNIRPKAVIFLKRPNLALLIKAALQNAHDLK